MKSELTGNYGKDAALLKSMLRVDKSYDVVTREIDTGSKKAILFFIDGFIKDEVMEKIMEFWMKAKPEEVSALKTAEDYGRKLASYVEVDVQKDCGEIVTAVLSGTLALVVEGLSEALMLDARTYPSRGVEEPDDDRVLRGSRDGFVETLVFNTALIRRRIRDPRLTMEIMRVGKKSKTDVVICYMEGLAEQKVLDSIRKRIGEITIEALTMSQESLAECLIKKQWYNPFPRVRYTERPDSAAACALEGKILILVDNSPAVMILPTAIFDFVQDTNDFYFPPLVGTYLRIVRIAVFFATLFLTPLWYLMIQNPEYLPSWLEFVQVKEPNSVPIIVQLLLIEFVIDGLKLASLNTPNVLASSFSVVGALILGDFAVKARWFVPEVVLYMAFVTIANFTQPSFELGYAFKLFRVLILVCTALWGIWGFAGGVILMILIAATTKTITGRNYLFPLFPFNGSAFVSLFIRKPISRKNS